MYYVVSDSGVYTSKSISEINKHLGTLIEEEEFQVKGADKIINLTSTDIEFLKDKRKMSRIFFGNFFKEDKATKICSIMGFVWTVLTFLVVISK